MKNFIKNIIFLKQLESEAKEKLNLKNLPKFELYIDLNTTRSLGFFKKDKNNKLSIHFHKKLFHLKKYREVIIHEYAHYLAYSIYGYNIMPHGQEWKYIMKILGSTNISTTTSDFTKEIIKFYPDKFITLKCNCGKIKISKNKGLNILKKKSYCLSCGKKIKEFIQK
jgi:predicted SprT family Zn-dependent metalloprotease